MNGIGISPFFKRGGSSTPTVPVIDTEWEAFRLRLVDPITDESGLVYNGFWQGAKQFNGLDLLSDALFYMYICGGLGSEANSRLNAINSSFPLANQIGSPTWANTGVTGGINIALKNGFNDSIHAPAECEDDLLMMCYTTTEGNNPATGSFEIDFGNVSDTDPASFVASRYDTLKRGMLNVPNPNSNELAAASLTAIGLSSVSIQGTLNLLWKNDTVIFQISRSATGINNGENYFLAARNNLNGFAVVECTKELYFFAKGFSSLIDVPDFNYRIGLLRAGTVFTPKPELGQIFTDDFVRSSVGGNYDNASGAFACNGSNLVATNASGGEWDKELIRNTYTSCVEKSTTYLYTQVDSTSSLGPAISYKGIYNNLQIRLNFSSGEIEFFNSDGANPLKTSTASLSLSNNDLIRLIVKDHKGRFLATAHIVNGSGVVLDSITETYTYGLTFSQTNLRPSYFKVGIKATGGTQNISLFRFVINEIKNADLHFVGDSNFFGFYANYQSNSIPNRVGLGQYYCLTGGPGLKTSDINWDEVVALNATKVVCMLGTNDYALGVSISTIVTNLETGANTVIGAGKQFVLCIMPPLNAADVALVRTAVLASATLAPLVGPDLFELFKNILDSDWQASKTDDFIHIKSTAHAEAATEITNNI